MDTWMEHTRKEGRKVTRRRLRHLCAFFLVSAFLISAACNHAPKGRESDSSSLQVHVSLYCHGLTLELEQAGKDYRSIAPRLETLRPDQRQRAETLLRWDSIGVSEDVRRDKLREVRRRLDFCVVARSIDIHTISDLQARANDLMEQLGPNLDGQLPAHGDAAKALDNLAALSREVDALPLRE